MPLNLRIQNLSDIRKPKPDTYDDILPRYNTGMWGVFQNEQEICQKYEKKPKKFQQYFSWTKKSKSPTKKVRFSDVKPATPFQKFKSCICAQL